MTDVAAGAAAVDVILPTYRRPHTIGAAIRSVLRQTHQDLTLHVVGDGCSEETEAVVRACDDPRLRFQRFPKAAGFGYVHRNVVLKASAAPYVAYMTDDDLWFPDHLERALAVLREGQTGLVAFRSIQVRFPDVLDPYFFAFDWRLGPPSRWLRHWFMGSVNCVHRRDVFEAVGYWNDHLFRFGDREFYNRVRVSAVPTRYVDHVTVLRFYAQHWDGRYGQVAEPPQGRYLDKLADPAWRESVHAALGRRRDAVVRRRQAADFFAFAIRSGPKFARFWYQKLRSPAPVRA
ncbi:MAG TPA: glycosyltransferase family A protein [Vicinamibacteria bacterium]|nr:glycosyltransferase family A protein [Vicinamibacteria bacterium]